MRVIGRIARSFGAVREEVHEGRWQLVWSLTESLCLGAEATVTSLGRGLQRDVLEKHAIKCADRALSNKHLQRERPIWYREIARHFIGPDTRPVIAIDATDLTGGLGALRASVAFDGRAITILNEVERERAVTQRRVQRTFLRKLQQVLPIGCRPVLVVDGGFRGPFFEEVRKLGWDFVGRPASNVHLCGPDFNGQVRDLYGDAPKQPRDLGWHQCTRQGYAGRIVVHDGRSRNAKKHRCRGQERERKRRLKAAEPWVLVTSLSELSARKVVEAYRTRMQIEETFRDDKSSRFGRSLELARCRSKQRLNVLLLLLALASFVLLLIGVVTEAHGRERAYRANTSRRRSLSLVALGMRVLHRDGLPASILEAYESLTQRVVLV